MENIMRFLQGKKTYLTAAASIIGAWAAVANGAMAFAEAVQVTVTAVLAATLRNGVANR